MTERFQDLVGQLNDFMTEQVYPAEHYFHDETALDGWNRPAVMADLKTEARRRGLWNLFLQHHPSGAGLTLAEYADLAEITGRSPLVAPEAVNCSAPDTGNMELLAMFGTQEQQGRWLSPLLNGEIRSAYCMTEPDVASSDATNLQLAITTEGDSLVLNGRKWWSTGILSDDCQVLLVLGATNPDASKSERYSVVLVPRNTPGITVVRGLSVFGFWDRAHGGHGEVAFDNVRVPIDSMLGAPGQGFALGQARLGPGRVHHCMRLIGMAERAFDLMCERAWVRSPFGAPLATNADVAHTVADCRIQIDMTRALVKRTAQLIDEQGAKAAMTEISEIKIVAPTMAQDVIDKAIQVHGAAGLTVDFPLAVLFAQARGLRFADGPEEVHRRVLARRELSRYRPQ